MSLMTRELVLLILQYLDEEKFKNTVHRLEQESGFLFNMKYFEELVTGGDWDEAEKYLSGFTKVEDNRYSMKIFFEIRKQKYLEALDSRDRSKAVEILVKDLKVFKASNEDLFKEITVLLTLDNFRENEQLSKYGDTKSARSILLPELKKLIEANPLFCDKLQSPILKNSRLQTLINQGLNWQHLHCKYPRPNPYMKTLLVDHTCGPADEPPDGARAPSPVTNPFMNVALVPKAGGFPPLGAHEPFQAAPASLPTSLAGRMANPSPIPHPGAPARPMTLGVPNNPAAIVKRPRTSSNSNAPLDYQTAVSEHVLKRARPLGAPYEYNNPVNVLPVAQNSQSHGQSSITSDHLPRNVVMNLSQGSAIKSLDFHPLQQILLLVGTNMGIVMVWELVSREIIMLKNFKLWELGACSMPLQALLSNDYSASINRVMWSPDGALFGVAYSKHIVHIYSYHGPNDMRNHLEIEAHAGSVNDLAFSYPTQQLSIVTCGEDRLVKVWDAVTGAKQYTFEGHESPVYSVCPHHKENIQFIFSTATDGKIIIFSPATDGNIKAWMYDNLGSRAHYDAPGHLSTMMAYSADGSRLFSCGTNKEGESFLVEWNESAGTVKHTYLGLGKRSVGVVQFDTTRSRFLAAGDEFTIKFWDMESVNLLTTTDADGGLPASPCIRFNKEGTLMAVSTSDNGVKILANAEGLRLLRTCDVSRVAPTAIVKGPTPTIGVFTAGNAGMGASIAERTAAIPPMVGMNADNRSLVDVNPKFLDESADKSKLWKLSEISEPSQCRSQRLPDSISAMRVSRLIYTNSGLALLALASNAVHKLWKWPQTDRNSSGKATASIAPQLWQPSSGVLMTNDLSDANPEYAVSCFALSNNDSYLMSASGGKISIFNMMSFKTMTTFMPPPPSATFFAFHPQDNNIVAIGMVDSSIQIYNVRDDKVKIKLKGHQKRITGLAFSSVQNVLVSSGADSQLCVWSVDGWERLASKPLQIPTGRTVNSVTDIRVQFHQDQTHLLAVHDTQIAIYEAPRLECLKQLVAPESRGPITHATYSCDSRSIYVSFEDGSISILTASNLRLRCRINPNSYLPPNPSMRVYPLCIAAHPSEANQFALGLIDGGVCVLEPLETEGQWGTPPPPEKGAGNINPSGSAAAADQTQR